jgi:hypothetical protein
MTMNDTPGDRARLQEEEYFRRRDQDLIEKMRRARQADEARQSLGAAAGLTDPDAIQQLQALGFTPETVNLLPLVPVLQVAWAEGGVTADERAQIVALARARGIAAGSAADAQLSTWLTDQPDPSVFAGAGRLIRAMLDSGSAQMADLTPEELVSYCEKIAKASGGFLGFGKVSDEERTLLSSIATELRTRRG